MSYYGNIRVYDETSRIGLKWTEDEDAKLIQAIQLHIPYDKIAVEHKRTVKGIKSRIITNIIYPLHKEGKSIAELSAEYNIEEDIINKYIENLQSSNNTPKMPNKNNQTTDKKINIIIDKMTLLENKMNDLHTKLDTICKMNELNNKMDLLLQQR